MHVDLRPVAEADSVERFVVLCARKSEPWGTGHSFVVWVTHDLRTNETRSQGFGFYPGANRVLVKLAGGKGRVLDESNIDASIKAGLLTHRLILQVNRAQFESAWSAKQDWERAEHHYHLVGRNCTHFSHRIGTSLGLDAPQPTAGERPPLYFERLMQFCRQLP